MLDGLSHLKFGEHLHKFIAQNAKMSIYVNNLQQFFKTLHSMVSYSNMIQPAMILASNRI